MVVSAVEATHSIARRIVVFPAPLRPTSPSMGPMSSIFTSLQERKFLI